MVQVKKRIVFLIAISAWLLLMLGGSAWWLFPRFALRWAGSVADAVPFLCQPIADRLFDFSQSEMRVASVVKGSAERLLYYQRAYHLLNEGYRLYVRLNAEQPADKRLEKNLIECGNSRYAVTLFVGVDVPP